MMHSTVQWHQLLLNGRFRRLSPSSGRQPRVKISSDFSHGLHIRLNTIRIAACYQGAACSDTACSLWVYLPPGMYILPKRAPSRVSVSKKRSKMLNHFSIIFFHILEDGQAKCPCLLLPRYVCRVTPRGHSKVILSNSLDRSTRWDERRD